MEKDRTEVGITGKPVPKPRTAKQQYELEKKRRMRKHLGKNVGGTQYSSDVNPYLNPRSVREEVLVDYLLEEGFASDEKSAQAIAGAMSEEWRQDIMEAAVDQSDKQIEKGIKTTYKAQNVIDNQHQGRSRGLNRLSTNERGDKSKRMSARLKSRRDDLFQERGKREDEKREKLKKMLGL